MPPIAAFQLTAPLREPTALMRDYISNYNRFNSRLPCGSRLGTTRQRIARSSFQLTAPLREPTIVKFAHKLVMCCFNSRLPCGSRPISSTSIHSPFAVSTHGSLAGADSKNSHFQETFHKKKNAFSCFSNFFITFFYNIRFDLKK